MKRSEYCVIELSGDVAADDEALNAYGREGWKLVSVVVQTGGLPVAYFVFEGE